MSATERSSSATVSARAKPRARIARKLVSLSTLMMFGAVAKLGAKTTKTAIIARPATTVP